MSLQHGYTYHRTVQSLPGTIQARPLDFAERHLPEDLSMSEANQLTDQDNTALLAAILAPWDALDITPNEPWSVGGLRCARESDDPDVLTGWRRLCLPGIDGHPHASDRHGPHLHLTPEGGILYQPGPYCKEPGVPELIAVETLDQLLEMLGRTAPFADATF